MGALSGDLFFSSFLLFPRVREGTEEEKGRRHIPISGRKEGGERDPPPPSLFFPFFAADIPSISFQFPSPRVSNIRRRRKGSE